MPITISGGVQLTGPVTLGPGAGAAPTPGAENFGYIAGGAPPATNKIQKYSFTSDGNSTNVGTLVSARGQLTGNSSDVSGYAQGGYVVSYVNQIDKWPFASDGAASFVGNLSSSRRLCSGQSSIENGNGYQSGGLEDNPPSQARVTKVDKFSFDAIIISVKVVGIVLACVFKKCLCFSPRSKVRTIFVFYTAARRRSYHFWTAVAVIRLPASVAAVRIRAAGMGNPTRR